jgi:hypothetical protein
MTHVLLLLNKGLAILQRKRRNARDPEAAAKLDERIKNIEAARAVILTTAAQAVKQSAPGAKEYIQ